MVYQNLSLCNISEYLHNCHKHYIDVLVKDDLFFFTQRLPVRPVPTEFCGQFRLVPGDHRVELLSEKLLLHLGARNDSGLDRVASGVLWGHINPYNFRPLGE